jgi:septal ring-binding cell division protein DamX
MQGAAAWLRKNNKLALGIGFALVMSTLMMLWIQPEAFGLKATKPVVATPLTSPQLTVPTTANVTASTSTANAAAVGSSAPSEQESPSPAAPQAQTASAPATAPVAMATTPPETPIETPEGTLKGQEWLRKLDANTFLLQHGTASSYAKVLAIQRRHPPLKDAQIIAAYRPGEKLAHFVIVSGPYRNVGQGYEASKRPGIPRSWVRPTRGLQEQLKSPT